MLKKHPADTRIETKIVSFGTLKILLNGKDDGVPPPTRDSTNGWISRTPLSRSNDKRFPKMIIVMQRVR